MKAYSAARSGGFVLVRAHGLANMKTAPVLDAFLRQEIEAEASEVCIDLSECTGMDSTFMGTLVGFAELLRERSGRLMVVNPGERNRSILSTLGVDAVLPVVDTADLTGYALRLEALDIEPVQSMVARMEMIRRAHQNLSAISEENAQKFADFLAALGKDLAKFKID